VIDFDLQLKTSMSFFNKNTHCSLAILFYNIHYFAKLLHTISQVFVFTTNAPSDKQVSKLMHKFVLSNFIQQR
jgi:hypothetical protein